MYILANFQENKTNLCLVAASVLHYLEEMEEIEADLY